jgi:flagellar biosynthetic protein FliQ
MNALEVVDVTREALFILIKLSTPVMLVGLAVGLAISLIQALTQIQEMTLSFVPKIIAIYFTIMLLMPYMISTLNDFNVRLSERIANIE